MIPKPDQKHILNELHGGHPGVIRMTALARMFVWWVIIDRDIETVVKQCEQIQPSPPVARGSGLLSVVSYSCGLCGPSSRKNATK